MMKKGIVFLDRDGVVNIDSTEYIKTPDEFRFIPKSPEAVALLCDNGYEIILITNQSMIGRKMATQGTLDAIFKKMVSGIEKAGGRIKDIFFCPHLPNAGCRCRKPKPGMILSAVEKHGIDLSHAIMIGDSAKDIEAGIRAGCATTILVLTGNGKTARAELIQGDIRPSSVAVDLYDAACRIVNEPHPS